MTVHIKLRVPFWFLVSVAALLLASGLFALLSLDAATSKAVAGELENQTSFEQQLDED